MQSRFLHPVKQGFVATVAVLVEHRGPELKGTETIFDEQDRPVMTFEAFFQITGPSPSAAVGSAGGPKGKDLP